MLGSNRATAFESGRETPWEASLRDWAVLSVQLVAAVKTRRTKANETVNTEGTTTQHNSEDVVDLCSGVER